MVLFHLGKRNEKPSACTTALFLAFATLTACSSSTNTETTNGITWLFQLDVTTEYKNAAGGKTLSALYISDT
ncbi:MAG: hypothetical protein J1D88_05285 [Treponema sp.]|nr:hypothetical protein [Treponema sp.]